MDGGLINSQTADERLKLDDDRLRVLLVVESSGGGTGRHVLDLAEGLIQRGCEVHLLHSTRRMDGLFRERLARTRDLRHAVVDMRRSVHPSDLLAVWAIRKYRRRHGPFDVIHGHSSKGGACARLAAFGTRTPAVYTMHGLIMMDPSVPAWKRAIYHAIECCLSLRTRAIIAVSPEERRSAIGAGLGSRRVKLAPNGVEPFDGSPRADARKAMGCDDDHYVVFGYVGRLVSGKAPDVLVNAFAQVVAMHPNARLAVIGDGPMKESLVQLAGQLRIAKNIRFLGEMDARRVLAGFDVFVMPSRKEGLPYVVLEAMSAGLPVVATQSSGVEILVEAGVNGAVTPTDDVAAMAAAMTELAGDSARRERFGRASRAMAGRFTLDAMVELTMRIYQAPTNEDIVHDSPANQQINPAMRLEAAR